MNPNLAARIVDHLHNNGSAAESAANRQILTLAEEVGEFISAWRRYSGQDHRNGDFDDVRTRLADVVITAYLTANELDIDLDKAITDKLTILFGTPAADTQERKLRR